MSLDLDKAQPAGYARHLATYIRCPSTIRARTLDFFGYGPSIERCRKFREEVEERERRETAERSCGISPLFTCGHPRSFDNIVERNGTDRCKICRTEVEREAARREQVKAERLERLAKPPVGALTPDQLISLAADLFDTTAADIVSSSRHPEHVMARAAVAEVLRTERGLSMVAVGRKLGGRDHSTIINAIQRLPAYIARRPEIAEAVFALAEAARRTA